LTKIELNIPFLRALSRDYISELHLDQLGPVDELDPSLRSPRAYLPEQLALEPVDGLVAFRVVDGQPEVDRLTRLKGVSVQRARDLSTPVLNEAQTCRLVVLSDLHVEVYFGWGVREDQQTFVHQRLVYDFAVFGR
jgi:hypothetical protein